jgi:hypothetical protein
MDAQRDDSAPEVRKPRCKLVGTDGNVFAIIGHVAKALKADGQKDRAREWTECAMSQKSYSDVLALVFEYVEPF